MPAAICCGVACESVGVRGPQQPRPTAYSWWDKNPAPCEHPIKNQEKFMKILNLTQHQATPEQIASGVVDIDDAEDLRTLKRLLTFESMPTRDEVISRAEKLADWASGWPLSTETWEYAEVAMIGGAPFLMAPLELALRELGIMAVYAFSVRESVEEMQADGTVKKINVFKHAGFVGL